MLKTICIVRICLFPLSASPTLSLTRKHYVRRQERQSNWFWGDWGRERERGTFWTSGRDDRVVPQDKSVPPQLNGEAWDCLARETLARTSALYSFWQSPLRYNSPAFHPAVTLCFVTDRTRPWSSHAHKQENKMSKMFICHGAILLLIIGFSLGFSRRRSSLSVDLKRLPGSRDN